MKIIKKSKKQRDIGFFERVTTALGCLLKDGIFKISAVVALIGACWLLMQHQSISNIETKTSSLEKQIATARHQSPPNSIAAHPPTKQTHDATDAGDQAINWKEILPLLADPLNSMALIPLHKRMEGMTVGEIVAEMGEINRLDLPPESRYQLVRILLPTLAKKDPETALEKFLNTENVRYLDPTAINTLADAMDTWAQKDIGKAEALMNEKIASGLFENKNLAGYTVIQLNLEKMLVKNLLPSDPTAAGRRISELSEEGAFWLLGRNDSYADQHSKDDAAYAALTRDYLSESRRIQLFSEKSSRLSKNYADVTGYLDRISATPNEREACVEAVGKTKLSVIGYERPVTTEDVDQLREWAGTEHPDINKVTGIALGNAVIGERMTYEDASDLVLHYYELSGDDSVIQAFLTDNARCFGEKARALANNIADPDQRSEILGKIR